MENFNGVILSGRVSGIKKGGFVLTTENVASNGETYTQEIPIILAAKDQPENLADGMHLSLQGKLVTKTNKAGTIQSDMVEADPATVQAKDDEHEYMNVARLIGKIRYPFQYLSKARGKQPFGNLAVAVGKSVFRGVLFQTLATVFDREAKTGLGVRLQGNLRNREYTDRAGVIHKILEIRADPDWTEILDSADDVDPFSTFDEQAPAAAEGPAF
jgi:hypothetical protein